MSTAREKLKELQKSRRLCLQHLRRGLVLFGITAVVLIVVQQFITIRLWVPFLILGVLSFTMVGDAVSYYSCGRQIRRLQHD
jgi:hypothetical protein